MFVRKVGVSIAVGLASRTLIALPGQCQCQDTTLPDGLPVPADDGACSHLVGSKIPSLHLTTTAGSATDISLLSGLTILFIYPRTAAPEEIVPDSWNMIPGARGCTPQVCSFRDLSESFLASGVSHIFGMSTQSSNYQAEVKARLHLPFQLLSDEALGFQSAMQIPTFEWEGKEVMRRVTLAIVNGIVVNAWYPVFPPHESADQVMEWLDKEWKGRTSLSTEAENQMMRNMQHR